MYYFKSWSQDPSFSQIDNKSMYMNPALCGSSGHPKFMILEGNNGKELMVVKPVFNRRKLPFTNSLIEASMGILVIIKEMVELRRSILVFHI